MRASCTWQLLLVLAAAGCSPYEEARREARAPEPRRVITMIDLPGPESVRYDPAQDAFLVSNMTGFGSVKDNNGTIVRFAAGDPGRSDILVQGGVRGATLHAPKGMAISGDTLWVADIDVLRGFHRVNGMPLATIDFAALRPGLLNDVALAPDGTLRVTDTGIRMSPKGVVYTGEDQVLAVGPGQAIHAIARGRQLRRPNGIIWDSAGSRWVIASFDPFISSLYALDSAGAMRIIAKGKGKWDGVEALGDGRLVVSSWTDSTVHVVDGSDVSPLVRPVPEPADMGVDTRRNRLAIPVSVMGRVEVWQLPPRRVRPRDR